MWGSPRGDNSKPDASMFEQFAAELGYIYDRTNLSVTFPDMLIDMMVESSSTWEIRTSNLLQKCQMFYDYNVVTQRRQLSGKNVKLEQTEEIKAIEQSPIRVKAEEGKPHAVGRVLVICNDETKNQFGHLEGEAQIEKLKEIYVDLTHRRKKISKEEAEQQFDLKVRDNEEERKFQTTALLGACKSPLSEKAFEDAVNTAKELGYQDSEIIRCRNFSKEDIKNQLQELKECAKEAEKNDDVKA